MTTEREWKALLDQEGYERLRSWAAEQGVIVGDREQTNHYLDTPKGELATHHMLLRLREADAHWQLTFKRVLASTGELGQHCEEVEIPISEAEALEWLSRPEEILAVEPPPEPLAALRAHADQLAIPLTELASLGILITQRTRIRSPSGQLTLELDHSRYGDPDDRRQDFELECEGEDLGQVRTEVTALLDRLGVRYTESTRPKLARLLAARQQ